MTKILYILTLTLFGCVSNPTSPTNISVFIATPIEAQPTGAYLNIGCCESCLCHGTDVYKLLVKDVETLYGQKQPNTIELEILDGFLKFDWTGRSPTSHLFVVRLGDSTLPRVVEADPLVEGKACIWNKLEDYVHGTAPYFNLESMDTFRPESDQERFCYEKTEIRKLLRDT